MRGSVPMPIVSCVYFVDRPRSHTLKTTVPCTVLLGGSLGSHRIMHVIREVAANYTLYLRVVEALESHLRR